MLGIAWFLLGFFVNVYILVLLRRREARKRVENKEGEYETKAVTKFYLNIFILNKDEAIEKQVKQKVANRFVAGVVGSVLKNTISDEKFADRIGTKITELIPIKLSDFGIKSVVEVAYQKGAFLCVKVDILTADARKIIAKKGGKVQLDKFNRFMSLIGIRQLGETIDNSLATLVGEKMQANLPVALKERMQEKAGLDVKVVALSEEKQADFLLKTLKGLREQEEAAK
jgi:hypothetical protein